MNAVKMFIACCLVLGIMMAAGCGDDTVAPPEEKTTDRPAIPEPTYYSGPVPEKSLEMVVKTVPLTNFVASVDSLIPPYCCDHSGCDFNCKFYGTYPGPNRIKLVKDRTIISDLDSLETDIYYHPGGSWGLINGAPLSSTPYLEHVRYWRRLGAVERYSGSTSTTVTRSTTRGVERTRAEEFGMSIGMETSVSGGLFVDFSMTLSMEFSYSSSTSLSVSEEETVEESFTISCPTDKNIVYCVWQLVDEFRIIGVDGQVYSDPSYVFTDNTLEAVSPTSEFVPITTYFDHP